MKLRSLNPYRVAEHEEMICNEALGSHGDVMKLWGIIAHERWKMTHFLGYLWPDEGKTQNPVCFKQ